jgi:hypothetical protein
VQAIRHALVRNDPRNKILLDDHENPQQQGQHHAVDEGAGENLAFLAGHAHGGDAGGDVLRGDHFAHHAAGGTGGSDQDRAEIELAGCHHLQIAEQGIAESTAKRHAMILSIFIISFSFCS